MKKRILFCCLCCFFAIRAAAQSVVLDGCTYTITGTSPRTAELSKGRELTGVFIIPDSIEYGGYNYAVTSIGDWAFSWCSDLTSITIPDGVTSIGDWAFSGCFGLTSITISDGVTSIGDSAFSGCSSLTSVTIPDGVTSIGDWAFSGCFGLTSITIPDGVTSIGRSAFKSCTGLASITIPDGVTSIGDEAFLGCAGLTSITIPDGVTSIGSGTFSGCSSLTSITIPDGVTNIGESAFSDCSGLTSITIPDGVTSIGSGAFKSCSGLTSITIPDGVTSIGSGAFKSCTGLASIAIPDGVTSIGSGAFKSCTGLTSITIPDGVTSIGDSVFYDCSGLTSITIPDGVTSIDNQVFYGCSGLTSITIPDGVTSIGNGAFKSCTGLASITIPEGVTTIGDGAFAWCSSITSVIWNAKNYLGFWFDSESNAPFYYISSNITSFTFGDKVEHIPHYLCYGMSKLTSITIPDGVTSIGESAFSDCSGLTSITIPKSVTSIEDRAFSGCSGLTSVTIPDSVTSIGYWAFSGCSSLTSITCEAITPPVCASDAFNGVSTRIIVHIPCGTIDAYRSATGWNECDLQEPPMPFVAVYANDTEMGQVDLQGPKQDLDCEAVATFSATPNFGCHFVQWSDGDTNPARTIILTQDTALIAIFAKDYSGKCGDDLYWEYDNNTIKITGTGTMYDYTESTQPWLLLRDSIKTVQIGHSVVSIGENAFAQTPKLARLVLGTSMENIAGNAFAGCNRLYDICCYATYPPFADGTSFANYNVYLYVPCEDDVLRGYKLDAVWGLFRYIECIESIEVDVPTNTVTVTPSYEDATFTWPSNGNANAYTLEITKDGVVFCTLTFNANGQLMGIAFAPSKDRNNAHAPQAAQATTNGWQFTVTGLNEGSNYAYTMTVTDNSNTVLQTYEGTFTTLGGDLPEGLTQTTEVATGVQKIISDGQVLILRGDKTYTLTGLEVR